MLNKIEKKLIDAAIQVIKEGEGCLFVIKLKDLKYELMITKRLESFNILDDREWKNLIFCSKLDGACIVDENGFLIDFGVKINDTKAFSGFGTRHSAAYSASLKGNICILGSQENKKVRIFKEGKMVMQIDALEKGIEKKTDSAVNILESIGAGALSTIGLGLISPIGVAVIPGILIFGSAHYLFKQLHKIGEK